MNQFSIQMVIHLFHMVYDNLMLHLKHRKLIYYEYVPNLINFCYFILLFPSQLIISQFLQTIEYSKLLFEHMCHLILLINLNLVLKI